MLWTLLYRYFWIEELAFWSTSSMPAFGLLLSSLTRQWSWWRWMKTQATDNLWPISLLSATSKVRTLGAGVSTRALKAVWQSSNRKIWIFCGTLLGASADVFHGDSCWHRLLRNRLLPSFLMLRWLLIKSSILDFYTYLIASFLQNRTWSLEWAGLFLYKEQLLLEYFREAS